MVGDMQRQTLDQMKQIEEDLETSNRKINHLEAALEEERKEHERTKEILI